MLRPGRPSPNSTPSQSIAGSSAITTQILGHSNHLSAPLMINNFSTTAVDPVLQQSTAVVPGPIVHQPSGAYNQHYSWQGPINFDFNQRTELDSFETFPALSYELENLDNLHGLMETPVLEQTEVGTTNEASNGLYLVHGPMCNE